MTAVTVVSGRIDDLRLAIEQAQIPNLACRYFSSPDQMDEQALQAEIAVGAPDVLAPALPHMPHLQWVQSTWAGITPFLASPRRDYQLTGVKAIFGASMSEYVLAWMLAFERSVLAHASAHRWEWREERGLSSLRLGIAGTGSIGAAVAKRCAPFFAHIQGLNSDGRDVDGFARCFSMRDVQQFSQGLDALVMILPDTPRTSGLIEASVLERLNPGAVLINTGRANSLNHEAMLAALNAGRLRAVVLDVLHQEPLPEDHPYWTTEGLYITSHTSAPTRMAAIVQVFRDNLLRYRSGEALQGLIDFERGY
ncbi:MAG: D-2-hydroxyacid dehydrogenase [Congregibacter sp.]